jgi:Na+/H+ antiporter NhaD/arsenite permease-like protein
MYILMVVIFVLGYVAIALEHKIKIDKAASALFIGVSTWTVYVFGAESILNLDYSLSVNEILRNGTVLLDNLQAFLLENKGWENLKHNNVINHFIVHELRHHMVEISEILFFLLGAMTIVELIDAHEGFAVITKRIKTTNKVTLMWLLCLIAFFFSAVLDNLTTAIVMSALIKKLIRDKEDMWFFGGMIIISANAGGAWSPIGDVTTIMLWIGGQVTAGNIVTSIFIPSLVSTLIPLLILTFTLKGNITSPKSDSDDDYSPISDKQRNIVFFLGLGALLFVPVFKTVTHLPPFMGILFGLSVLWIVTELMHKNKSVHERKEYSVIGVLTKIDVPSVLFFLGILAAVASLQSAGHLTQLATVLDVSLGDAFGDDAKIFSINIIIGFLSSIVDNVPLVAAAMGMYPMAMYSQDHMFWEFLAYCAGTGGSCLIIGSAAGVAMMGILKIDFVWYLKKISWLAIIGYLSGAVTYILLVNN